MCQKYQYLKGSCDILQENKVNLRARAIWSRHVKTAQKHSTLLSKNVGPITIWFWLGATPVWRKHIRHAYRIIPRASSVGQVVRSSPGNPIKALLQKRTLDLTYTLSIDASVFKYGPPICGDHLDGHTKITNWLLTDLGLKHFIVIDNYDFSNMVFKMIELSELRGRNWLI